MRENLADLSKKLGFDEKDISTQVNMIYMLADCIEIYYFSIESRFKQLGYRLPKLKQECYELVKASRALVRTVNKVCSSENSENFAEESEAL